MKRIEYKLVAIMISLSLSAAVLLGSCSLDMDKASKAVSDLGNSIGEAVNGNSGETAEATESIIVETETTPAETEPLINEEITPEITPTPEPTPAPSPTATPTPSPTPAPQRVDFSELTTDELKEGFEVLTEEFEEGTHAEDDTLLASFSGQRLAVSLQNALNVQTAINLMCDGFYMEAEGLYNRYANEGEAEYALYHESQPSDEEEAEENAAFDPYIVKVMYDYSSNGRLLTVMSEYFVARGQEIYESSYEHVSYDMYTGQIVDIYDITSDPEGLMTALAESLAASTDDEADTAEDYYDIYIVAEEPGSRTNVAEVRGSSDQGEVSTVVSVDDISGYFNRYGNLVFGNG